MLVFFVLGLKVDSWCKKLGIYANVMEYVWDIMF